MNHYYSDIETIIIIIFYLRIQPTSGSSSASEMTSYKSKRLREILLSESRASLEAKVELFKRTLRVHDINEHRQT